MLCLAEHKYILIHCVSAKYEGGCFILLQKKWSIALFAFVMMLSVVFSTTASAQSQFTDVPVGADGYEEINYLVELGVIKGYKQKDGTTIYKPNNAVTRAQAAKMVIEATGREPLAVKTASFTDVHVGTEQSGYIERAMELGLFNVKKGGYFWPNKPLTRDEMSFVLAKAFGLDIEATSGYASGFSDITSAHTYYKYINAIYYNGITTGDNGKYLPNNTVTRKHFALFVSRANSDAFRLDLPIQGVDVDSNDQVIAQVKVATADLNVRQKPTAVSTNIIGRVKSGDILSVYGQEGNWLKVYYEGKYGYVSRSYVKFLNASGKEIGNATGEVVANAATVQAYSQPATTAAKVGTFAKGAKITVYETLDGWYLTKVGSLPAYVQIGDTNVIVVEEQPPVVTKPEETKPVDKAPTTPPAAEKPTINNEAGVVKGRVTVGGLHVRAAASPSAKSYGKLGVGNIVTVHSISNYWAHVTTHSGIKGYVHKSYLKLLNQSGSVVKDRIIVLDPGHGGKDPGAVSGSYTEKSIVLKVSNLVKQKLEAQGAKVKMTRTGDTYPSLPERVAFSKNNYAEIFVSIHVNAASSTAATGAETFYSVSTGDMYKEDIDLATFVNNQIVKNAEMKNRGVRKYPYYVINNMDIPSILVELGFISNPQDRAKLVSNEYIEIYAQSIYNGIIQYYSKQ